MQNHKKGIERRFLKKEVPFFVAGKEAASMDKSKKPQQKQENDDAHAPPGKIYAVPSLKDTTRCKSCPYPSVGFICWSEDGSCLRTDMDGFCRPGR